uniref:ETFB lysine methyltransferase n=1 Tax=Homalodisca liturata TaxID=320908 RepID=A0A1B6IMP9_9HEMI
MDKFVKMRKIDPVGFFKSTKKTIERMTEVTNKHFLTPELSLRLVTPNCPLWKASYEECPVPDPFWAFYWPGGQALTRYLMDNKNIIYNKKVLDLGSGCGSLSIAAAKLGVAIEITANDIDPVAAVAISMNASLNFCSPNSINIITENLIESDPTVNKFDCILLGDMFYNEDFNTKLMKWLLYHVENETQIFIGDPGRYPKIFEECKEALEHVAEYPNTDENMKINGSNTNVINVWKMFCPTVPKTTRIINPQSIS